MAKNKTEIHVTTVFFQHITLVCDTGTFALQVIVL